MYGRLGDSEHDKVLFGPRLVVVEGSGIVCRNANAPPSIDVYSSRYTGRQRLSVSGPEEVASPTRRTVSEPATNGTIAELVGVIVAVTVEAGVDELVGTDVPVEELVDSDEIVGELVETEETVGACDEVTLGDAVLDDDAVLLEVTVESGVGIP